jgi:hypothetical protein
MWFVVVLTGVFERKRPLLLCESITLSVKSAWFWGTFLHQYLIMLSLECFA